MITTFGGYYSWKILHGHPFIKKGFMGFMIKDVMLALGWTFHIGWLYKNVNLRSKIGQLLGFRLKVVVIDL